MMLPLSGGRSHSRKIVMIDAGASSEAAQSDEQEKERYRRQAKDSRAVRLIRIVVTKNCRPEGEEHAEPPPNIDRERGDGEQRARDQCANQSNNERGEGEHAEF